MTTLGKVFEWSCDHRLGERIQAAASGDALVIMRQGGRSGVPLVFFSGGDAAADVALGFIFFQHCFGLQIQVAVECG